MSEFNKIQQDFHAMRERIKELESRLEVACTDLYEQRVSLESAYKTLMQVMDYIHVPHQLGHETLVSYCNMAIIEIQKYLASPETIIPGKPKSSKEGQNE